MKKLFLSLIFFTNILFGQNKENINEQKALIKKLNETDSLEIQGPIYFRLYHLNRRFEPKKGLQYLYKLLAINKSLKDSSKICLSYSQIGWCYIDEVENLDSAKVNLNRALQFAIKLNDSIRIGSAYTFLGFMNQRKGYYRSAINYYFKSLDYKIPLNKPNRTGFSYNLIGKSYELQNQYNKSLEYHFKALEERKKVEKYGDVAHSYQNIAEVYLKQKKYESSIEHFKLALEIRKRQNMQRHLAVCYNGLGENYFNIDSTSKAKINFELAIKFADSIKAPFLKSKTLNNLSRLHLELRQLQNAKVYVNLAEKLSFKHQYRDHLKDSYKILSQVYTKENNFKKALKYHTKYTQLKDSIINQETLTQIAELEGVYNTEKKEKEIESLTKEKEILESNERFKTLMTYTIILVCLFLVTLIWLYFNKHKQKLKQEKEIINLNLKSEQTKNVLYKEELDKFTQVFISKNNQLKNLQIEIDAISKNEITNQKLGDKLNTLYNSTILTNDDWTIFRALFDQVYPKFISNFLKEFPSASSGELKLAVLLKLNLSNSEISSILGISDESVRKSKYRLRKKLLANDNTELSKIIISI